MDVDRALPLLGGLSPQRFMRRHWQKRPLLVRGALPEAAPPLSRAALFGIVGRDEVESRLIVRDGEDWTLRHGPLPRRALPSPARPGWTLLVQALDLHADSARALLDRFRFLPDARLDDLMLSYASDGGGVGAHVDSYDVFLLQVAGRRRWRISQQRDLSLLPDRPLKLLARFEPEQEWLLEAGDMLYLPPDWAHEGTAVGADCMTCSIGLRAPARRELARAVLQRALDAEADEEEARAGRRYADAGEGATDAPGRIPDALAAFAADAVARFAADPRSLACALGEVLSEPQAGVWFDRADDADAGTGPAAVRRRRASRPPQPHALRRALRLSQRRVVPRARARRAAGAPAGRRAAPRRRRGGRARRRCPRAARPLDRRRLAAPRGRRRAGCIRMNDAPSLDAPIDGPVGFRAAVRRVLAEAAARGWRELRWCDADFAEWPLDDAAVLADLAAWLRPPRRLVLLASNYDQVARRHPRWTAWRRVWSHAVSCRQTADEVPAADVPTLLVASDACVLRLSDRLRCRGVVSTLPTDVAGARIEFDALLQHSGEAFGPTTLGI